MQKIAKIHPHLDKCAVLVISLSQIEGTRKRMVRNYRATEMFIYDNKSHHNKLEQQQSKQGKKKEWDDKGISNN